MIWFDIIILLILVGAFINGMQKGLTMQLAGFVSILLAAIFAGKVAGVILPHLLKAIHISESIARVVSYVLSFIIIVFAIRFIGKMFHTLIVALHMGFINKILGATLSLISTSLVLSILINLMIILDPEETILANEIKTDTFFYSKIQVAAPIIVPFLKEEVWDKHIQEKINQLEDKGNKQGNSHIRAKQRR